jgi:hypothetical protein
LWETQIVGRGGGGEWIGPFECVIFFAALVIQRWEIAGAWMAFKVASKWESWKNVVAVPEYLPRADPLDYLLARKRYGTLGYVTFLVGTALNAVLASVGAFIAMYHQ